MSEFDNLFNYHAFDTSSKARDSFVKSFQEISFIHYHNNEFIKFLWDKHSFHPSMIESEDDLEKAPFTMVNLFKEFELKSVPKENIELTLGSSGTSGQRSLIHLDKSSLENVKKMAYKIHSDLGIIDRQKYNYLCFTYDPKIAHDVGTAFTDELLTSFTQKKNVYYTLEFNEQKNDFEFNLEKTLNLLKNLAKDKVPLRILGFPAFLYETISKLDGSIKLPANSWVQTGGGWKSQTANALTKSSFRDLIEQKLGIPQNNIRDMFGMVEHGVPYLDCEKGRLRIPNFSRVFIRDPFSLKVLKNEQKGLIQFLCSYNSSYPSFNLLSTDWGIKRVDSSGEYIEICARAGISKHKGCALKANELLGDQHV